MIQQRVIGFNYVLKKTSGETLDSSEDQGPIVYLEGGNQVLPALEQALAGLQVGDRATVELSASEAYGLREDRWVIDVPRSELPSQEIEIGDEFAIEEEKEEEELPFRVIELHENYVVLDGNHPLAGQDLVFHVEIVSIRLATEEEIAHGHAHGQDGHDHDKIEDEFADQ